MPRHRSRRPPPIDDRDLAKEVLYLHSLWRRGPSAPAPAPAPVPAAAVPNQSQSGRRRPRQRKRRRSGADAEDDEPDSPREPSPPASPDASPSASPEELPPPSPVPVPANAADPNQSDQKRRRMRGGRGKRRRLGPDSENAAPDSSHAPSPDAAETEGTAGSARPVSEAWPDGPTSSKTPQPPQSPGSLAHRKAFRAAGSFFARHGSDGEGDAEEVSESEGDEEEAAEFFTRMFERDAELRGHYERGWEEGQFACMACTGRKARRGKARRFRGCVGLVQHARAATSVGRPGAHRALVAVVCRVLGWDINRLPSIVIDPRGTLSQALAAKVQSESDVQKAKENDESLIGDSNTNGDEVTNGQVTNKESAGMNDVEENAPLNSEDNTKNNVFSHETNQQEDAVKIGMEEASIDCEKVAAELNREASEKENTNKDHSMNQDNNGVIHEQDIAIETTEKENMKDTLSEDKCKNKNSMKASDQEEVNTVVSEPEQAKTADHIGLGDTAVTKLGDNPTEENVDENKEHADSVAEFFKELENEDAFTI